jgi:hypothetical protein
MNIRNRSYMQSNEFKERQHSFGYYCAQAYEFLVQFKTECLDGWKQLFKPAQQYINKTLDLPFALFQVNTYNERKQA